MRETIVKPPLTRKQIAKRVALFVCASAVFGGVAAVSFAAVKPFADRCFQENGMQETSSVEIFQGRSGLCFAVGRCRCGYDSAAGTNGAGD
ncbi:MAG: hypothetical protein ACLVAO_10430 [Clostridium fessum]